MLDQASLAEGAEGETSDEEAAAAWLTTGLGDEGVEEDLRHQLVQSQRQSAQDQAEIETIRAQLAAAGGNRAAQEAIEWRERAQQLEAQVVALRTEKEDALAGKTAAEEVERSVAIQNAELQKRMWETEQRTQPPSSFTVASRR